MNRKNWTTALPHLRFSNEIIHPIIEITGATKKTANVTNSKYIVVEYEKENDTYNNIVTNKSIKNKSSKSEYDWKMLDLVDIFRTPTSNTHLFLKFPLYILKGRPRA